VVEPATIAQWEILKEWEDEVDYWDGCKRYGESRVMVAPNLQAKYETYLSFHGIKYRMIVPDVEE